MKEAVKKMIFEAIESHFNAYFEELAGIILEKTFEEICNFARNEAKDQYEQQLERIWEGLHGLKESLENAQYTLECSIDTASDLMEETCNLPF